MLEIQNVNHVGIRVSQKQASIKFYAALGFELSNDVGFEKGHPVIVKHTGITHVALTVSTIDHARSFVTENDIATTGSLSFGNMSAIFIRDPGRNVIELDAYSKGESAGEGYEQRH